MKPFVKPILIALTTAVALSSTLAHAYALDDQLDCKSTAHAFIAPLREANLIEPTPMHVEPNSINAFRPQHKDELTAFGFKVFVVVAFQKDDELFRHGSGEPIGDSAYGAVVIGRESAVEAKVRAAGSDALIHHAAPFMTVIFCKPQSHDQ
jgi:hypothetical protein